MNRVSNSVNKKKILLQFFGLFSLLLISSCSINEKQIYYNEDINIVANAAQNKTYKSVDYSNEEILISSGGIYQLTGEHQNKFVTIKTTEKVSLILDNFNLVTNSKYAINVDSLKSVVVYSKPNTINNIYFTSLETDTDIYINSAIVSNIKTIFSGQGELNISTQTSSGIFTLDRTEFINANVSILSNNYGLYCDKSVLVVNSKIKVENGNIKQLNADYFIDETIQSFKDKYDNIETYKERNKKRAKLLEIIPDLVPDKLKLQVPNDFIEKRIDEKLDGIIRYPDVQARGILVDNDLTVIDSTIDITSIENAIHCKRNFVLNSGLLNLTAGHKAIHTKYNFTMNGGQIDIHEAFDGVEANTIVVNDGEINSYTYDDALNANDVEFEPELLPCITINGGKIVSDAYGDGFDSNGSIIFNGGYTIIDGPRSSYNGALDYNNKINAELLINGGTLLALGNLEKAKCFSNTSGQKFVRYSSNTMFNPKSSISFNGNGEYVISYISQKQFDDVIFSFDKFLEGSKYTLTIKDLTAGKTINELFTF